MSEVNAFLAQIEEFIQEQNMTATEFGRRCAGDPLFVFQIRNGREPRAKTRERVLATMAEVREPAQ